MIPSKQTLTLEMIHKIKVSTTEKVNLLVATIFIAEFKNQISALKDDFGETRFGEDHSGANLMPSEAIVLIIRSEVVFYFRCWIAG